MANERRILLGFLVLGAVGGIIWLCLQLAEPPEPIYKGKPLSYWLAGYNMMGGPKVSNPRGPSPPTREQANEALRQIGTNALPILLRMLQQPNSTLKERFLEMAQAQHFIKISYTPENRNFKTLAGFRALGSLTSNAVPHLIAIFDSDPSSFPQQAVPVILGEIGPAARQAIPAMLRGITHTNEVVRDNAMYALLQVHAEPKLVVPALIRCLNDPNAYIRAHAASALGTFGKDAQPAVATLLELCSKEISTPAGGIGIAGRSFNSMVMTRWGTFPTSLGPAHVLECVTNALKQIDPEALLKHSSNY